MVILSKNTRGYVKIMLGSLRKKINQYVKQIKYTNQGHLPVKVTPILTLQMNQSVNIVPVLEYTFVEDCK